MSMGKRERERQPEMWVTTTDLPTTASHPFYARLNQLLAEHHFDDFVDGQCQPFYAETMGRPGLPPGIYFRLLLIGYFEGIDAERGIAWRAADSLALRDFLGIGLDQAPPDHSTISRTRRLIALETHRAVFTWILQCLSTAGLVKGKTIGVDATTLEANAALRSIVRRDSGESYEEFLTKLAKASGIGTPKPRSGEGGSATCPAEARSAKAEGGLSLLTARASVGKPASHFHQRAARRSVSSPAQRDTREGGHSMASSAFQGPGSRATRIPARVRSDRRSLSNCAKAASTPSISFPVDVSIPHGPLVTATSTWSSRPSVSRYSMRQSGKCICPSKYARSWSCAHGSSSRASQSVRPSESGRPPVALVEPPLVFALQLIVQPYALNRSAPLLERLNGSHAPGR
jgi:transposase